MKYGSYESYHQGFFCVILWSLVESLTTILSEFKTKKRFIIYINKQIFIKHIWFKPIDTWSQNSCFVLPQLMLWHFLFSCSNHLLWPLCESSNWTLLFKLKINLWCIFGLFWEPKIPQMPKIFLLHKSYYKKV